MASVGIRLNNNQFLNVIIRYLGTDNVILLRLYTSVTKHIQYQIFSEIYTIITSTINTHQNRNSKAKGVHPKKIAVINQSDHYQWISPPLNVINVIKFCDQMRNPIILTKKITDLLCYFFFLLIFIIYIYIYTGILQA